LARLAFKRRNSAVDMAAASLLEHRKVNLHHRIAVADEAGQNDAVVEFGNVVTVET
jgi:hypothetical protein